MLCLLAVIILFFSRSYLIPAPDHTWQEIQERGSWRVGLDPSFPPFEMLDDKGQPIGFDVDLATDIAKAWDVRLELVALSFDGLSDALLVGKIDSIVSALPYDPRGTEDFAYSPPYFDAGIQIAVRADDNRATVAEMAGYRVAVEWGSMGNMVGRRLQREGASIEIIPYETAQEAVTALVQDSALDALLIDTITLRQAQGEGNAIKAVGDLLESDPYVIASPLAATILKEKLNQTLLTLDEAGRLTELETKWLIVSNQPSQ